MTISEGLLYLASQFLAGAAVLLLIFVLIFAIGRWRGDIPPRRRRERQAVKFCVDCRHYRFDRAYMPPPGFNPHLCIRKGEPNLVTGALIVLNATNERAAINPSGCGTNARYFEPKPVSAFRAWWGPQ